MKRTIFFLALSVLALNAFPEVVRSVEKVIPTFTRTDFILAQSTFKAGDIIGGGDIKETILNLKKTDLFGFVDIEAVKVDSGADVRVQNDSLS